MDERIESFLHDALSYGGRESVSIFLANYESAFPDIKRASYRERIIEEIARRKGTPVESQLQIALEVIDGAASSPLKEN